MDNFLQLDSLVSRTIVVTSSVYADEVTELLKYEEVKPVSKVVGAKYQIVKPPKQRV